MKSRVLKGEVKDLIKNKANIVEVTTGATNEHPTIVITQREPNCSDSTLYTNEADRDADLAELKELLK